jgi:hypothetical protein
MFKKLVFQLFLFIPLIGNAAFEDHFLNKTLRIDYIHCGNDKSEVYAIDEIIFEPSWDRSKTMLVDAFDYGKYKFMAYDSAKNELLFEKHYATMFGEWQTTAEAKTTWKSFSETVIMPYPKSSIRVEFFSRSKKGIWEKKFTTYINPESISISREPKYTRKTTRTWFSGEPSQRLDIVILAEGYTKWEMVKFRSDAQKFTNYLLECEPFSSVKDKINIWAVQAISEEAGSDIPGEGIWKNTVLNTNFYTFGSERYLTTMDNKTVRHLASNAPYDEIVVLVNTDKYGGGGFYNTLSVVSSRNSLSNFVFIHEFGHELAGLGDEYYASEVAMQDFYPKEVEPWEVNLTTLVDFPRKWKNMVLPGTPVPTPADDSNKGKTGVFEGGGYTAKGVYRPTFDCSMKSATYNNFCPVCKKALFEMVDYYTK